MMMRIFFWSFGGRVTVKVRRMVDQNQERGTVEGIFRVWRAILAVITCDLPLTLHIFVTLGLRVSVVVTLVSRAARFYDLCNTS